MKKFKIAIMGGDRRQEYLADMLAEKHKVTMFYMQENREEIHKNQEFDAYIFPIPISKDGVHLNTKLSENQPEIEEIIKKLPPKSKILGGNITQDIENLFVKNNLEIVDYYADEKLAILNAVPIAFAKSQLNTKNLIGIKNRAKRIF